MGCGDVFMYVGGGLIGKLRKGMGEGIMVEGNRRVWVESKGGG